MAQCRLDGTAGVTLRRQRLHVRIVSDCAGRAASIGEEEPLVRRQCAATRYVARSRIDASHVRLSVCGSHEGVAAHRRLAASEAGRGDRCLRWHGGLRLALNAQRSGAQGKGGQGSGSEGQQSLLKGHHLCTQLRILSLNLTEPCDSGRWQSAEAPAPTIERADGDMRGGADGRDGRSVLGLSQEESDLLIRMSGSTHAQKSLCSVLGSGSQQETNRLPTGARRKGSSGLCKF